MLAKILIFLYLVKKVSEIFDEKKKAKIIKRFHAYKSFASTYSLEIFNSFNHELQFKDTEHAIRNNLIDLLTELKGFKFVKILVSKFKKVENCDQTKYSIFYLNSKVETIINEIDINDVFESVYSTII